MRKLLMLCFISLLVLSFTACNARSIPIVGNGLQSLINQLAEEPSGTNDVERRQSSFGQSEQTSAASASGKEDEVSLNISTSDNILLVNSSDESLWYAYFAAEGSDAFSEDLLGSEVLSATEELSLVMPQGNGTYALRLENEAGSVYDFNDLPLSSGETLVFTTENGPNLAQYHQNNELAHTFEADYVNIVNANGIQGSSITIDNTLPETVFRLYMSRSDDTSWGEDLLGEGVLHAGGTLPLAAENAVSYDLNIEFEDGSAAEFYQIVLYTDDTLSLHEQSGEYVVKVINANGELTGEYYDATTGSGYSTGSYDTQYYGST